MDDEINQLSAEQAADLAELNAMADAHEPNTEAAEAVAQSQSAAESWAMLPAMVGSMICMALPELKAIYTPENCHAWGEAMVPVANEYGWDASEYLGPKMALAMATAPFVIGTIAAVKTRRQAEATKPAAAVASQPAPGALVADPGAGQKSVIIGSPIIE